MRSSDGAATSDGEPAAVHSRGRGRPRDPATDRTILQAAAELMTEHGVGGTTLTAVAQRAGVARATVYLRWPSRDALLGAVAKAAIGGMPFPLEGDLERDIRAGSAFVQQVIGSPQFQAIVPELVRALVARPPEVSFDALAPNRALLANEYQDLAEASGFDPGIDPRLAFDMLFGTAVGHLLATGSGPSRDYVAQLADVIISGLRRSRGGGA